MHKSTVYQNGGHTKTEPNDNLSATSQNTPRSNGSINKLSGTDNSTYQIDCTNQLPTSEELIKLQKRVYEMDKTLAAQNERLTKIENQIQELRKLGKLEKITDIPRYEDEGNADEQSDRDDGPATVRPSPDETEAAYIASRATNKRPPHTVTLHVNVIVYLDYETVLSRVYNVNAVHCNTLSGFWLSITPQLVDNLAEHFTSDLCFSDGMFGGADTSLTLEEDGHVATMSITPTKPHESCFPDLTYHAWYLRNVLRGRKETYNVNLKVNL